MDKSLFLKPRLSEKTYGLSLTRNTYTFEVPAEANRHSIAKAVAAQFNVTVEAVSVMNVKGKRKRTVRKGGRPTMGQRSDFKKAYVVLKAGDSLPIFAAIEDDSKSVDGKAAKQAAKDSKKEKQ